MNFTSTGKAWNTLEEQSDGKKVNKGETKDKESTSQDKATLQEHVSLDAVFQSRMLPPGNVLKAQPLSAGSPWSADDGRVNTLSFRLKEVVKRRCGPRWRRSW